MPHQRYYVEIAAAFVRGAHPRLDAGEGAVRTARRFVVALAHVQGDR